MVEDDDDEEREYVTKEDVIVVTDKKGVTDAKTVDNMVMNTNEIFLWWDHIILSHYTYLLCNMVIV